MNSLERCLTRAVVRDRFHCIYVWYDFVPWIFVAHFISVERKNNPRENYLFFVRYWVHCHLIKNRVTQVLKPLVACFAIHVKYIFAFYLMIAVTGSVWFTEGRNTNFRTCTQGTGRCISPFKGSPCMVIGGLTGKWALDWPSGMGSTLVTHATHYGR